MQALLLSSLFTVASATTGAVLIKNVPLVTQQPYQEWCWAASIKSLITYYDPTMAQKKVADVAKVFTTKDEYPAIDKINTILPNVVEVNGVKANLKATFVKGPLTLALMKKEIDAGRPFVFVIRWGSSGVYHCNVVYGYEPGTSNTTLYFMDPWDESQMTVRRTWTTVTGSNIDNSSGSWYASITVNKISSLVMAPQSASSLKPTINNGGNGGMVSLNLNGNTSYRTVAIYSLKGALLSRIILRGSSSETLPFVFSSGLYIAVLSGTGRDECRIPFSVTH